MISHHERQQCVHTTTEQVRCVQRESGITRSRDRDGGQLLAIVCARCLIQSWPQTSASGVDGETT